MVHRPPDPTRPDTTRPGELTDGGDKGGVERVLAEAEQKTRLSNSAVSDKQELEEVIVGFSHLPHRSSNRERVIALAKDLLNPSLDIERRQHKKKRLVQSPNSYFMDVKCPGCYKITTVFSHAQSVVLCVGCSTVLCQPTGGKARLTEGCSFRRKH
ncbi:ribosomal protein S27 like [Silurus meridionalis]|nr:ribosomal protein S27 like [Silurus meridionalis]